MRIAERSLRKIPGIVLLSHSQLYSTIAAGALNYRVREGNVCVCSAMDTGKNHNEESLEENLFEKNLSDETYKALTKVERDLFHGASQMKSHEKRWLSLTAD